MYGVASLVVALLIAVAVALLWTGRTPSRETPLERSRECDQLSNLAASGEMVQTDRCFRGKQRAAILGEPR